MTRQPSPADTPASHARGVLRRAIAGRRRGPRTTHRPSRRLPDRGVSEVIGFILIFGVLILGLTIVQLYGVPATNERLEFEHSQRALTDVAEVGDLFTQVATTGTAGSATVEAGMQYPSRLFLFNPSPVSGAVRTTGSGTVLLDNATGNGDVGDYWDGTAHAFETRSLSYRPSYTLYDHAPTRVIEHGLVYDRFENGAFLPRNRLPLVENRTVRLTTLAGSLDRATAGSIVIDVSPISVPTNSIAISDDGTGPVTVTLPSALSAEELRSVLEDELVANGGHVRAVRTGGTTGTVTIELETGITYDLTMARLGIDERGPAAAAHYVVPVGWSGGTIPEGSNATLVAEVRDRFNNPVSGVSVSAATTRTESVHSAPSAVTASATSDFVGRVHLSYEAPATIDGVTHLSDRIVLTIGSPAWVDADPFDPRTLENASVGLRLYNQDRSGVPGANDPGVGYGGTSQWSPTDNHYTFAAANGRWTGIDRIEHVELGDGQLVTREICSGSSGNPHDDCRFVDELRLSFGLSDGVDAYGVDVHLLDTNRDGDFTDSYNPSQDEWDERHHVTVTDASDGTVTFERGLTTASRTALWGAGVDILAMAAYASTGTGDSTDLDALKLQNATWVTGTVHGRVVVTVRST